MHGFQRLLQRYYLCAFASLREASVLFSFSQVFRKVRQSHQYNGQSHNICGIKAAEKYSTDKGRARQADDRPDNKNSQLIHMAKPSEELIT
jgi:hypothetical protein